MKNTLMLLSVFVLPIIGLAGESGYVFRGKNYVVYKDGEKVGKTFEEQFPEFAVPEKGRSIAAIGESGNNHMAYETDGTARCYRWSSPGPGMTDIFCIKL